MAVLSTTRTAAALAALAAAGCASGGSSWGGWFRPQGERWTILCLELQGAGCDQSARDVARALKQTPGIDPKEVRVRVRGTRADIYYGTYYRRVNPTTRARQGSPKLDQDLRLLRELADENGRRYFMGARRVPFPSSEAQHPGWALAGIDAAYSLQVAVYYNDDKMRDRKKAAVKKCRQLRARGYEAYYHHGETCSMVTVGTFGPEVMVDKLGRPAAVAQPGRRPRGAHRYSKDVLALQQKPECRYNLTNDNIEYNIDERGGDSSPVRSMLVRVPRPGGGS